MIRILFISQYLNRNGTEAFMMNLFRGVDRSLFMIDFLLYSWDETDYSREVEAAGGHVYRVPSRRQSPILWHRSLNKFFKEHAAEYQVIHFCGNSLTSMAPIYYAYKYGIPVRIVHAHSSFARGLHNQLLHRLKRDYVYRISTHHLACSSMAAEWFFGKKKSTIIRNGIDVKRFSYDVDVRREYRKAMGITEEEMVIGHVGRFTSEKNHTFILDVFAQYVERNKRAKLVLIGIGPLMEEMKQKAVQMRLQEKILFMGERSDVAELMQVMDVFLMPSVFEGLPFVLVEAQAAGLPCLIADTINKDIVITSAVHYMSLSDMASAWAEKLDDVATHSVRVKNDALLESAGYSIDKTIEYMQKLYQSATL